jgi:hypothetical protein
VLRRKELALAMRYRRKANMEKIGPGRVAPGKFERMGGVGIKNKRILLLGLDIGRLHQ